MNIDYHQICVNHLLNRCKNCKIDTNPNHPNNLDCPYYIPTKLIIFKIKKNITPDLAY